MKKAIKINLGGLIFHIDEDAYDRLKQYLSSLINQFGNNDEAREIVSDIESRIAELFQSRLNPAKQVINYADVEEIIGIMGKPNEYDTEPAAEEKQEYYQESGTYETRRRFYRDPDHRVFGGVCGGLGAYFRIDPVIFRILFIAFLFMWGTALLVYLILWIALPEARTAAQKLEMRGEPVNISNIERKVKQEYDQVKRNFKKIDPNNKVRNVFESVLHFFVTIFKGLFKIIAVIIGAVFILTGGILIAVFMAFIFGKPEINGQRFNIGDLNFMLGQFSGTGMHVIAIILVTIICAIPIISILYFGLKLIFKFKTNDRYFWISAVVLWIGSIMAFVIMSVSFAKDLSEESFKTSKFDLNTSNFKSMSLLPSSEPDVKKKKGLFTKNEAEYFVDEDDNIYGQIKLVIERSMENTGYVEVERKARGSSYENANYNAQSIQYEAFQRDSLLIIDPYFGLKPNDKWRAQKVDVTVYIPAGTEVYIDKKLENILVDADVDGSYWMHELPGKTWIMTEKGLTEKKQ